MRTLDEVFSPLEVPDAWVGDTQGSLREFFDFTLSLHGVEMSTDCFGEVLCAV